MDNINNLNEEVIKRLEKIGKYEIELIMNKKLFELQVIPQELYQKVMDKLLFKVQNLRDDLELIQNI